MAGYYNGLSLSTDFYTEEAVRISIPRMAWSMEEGDRPHPVDLGLDAALKMIASVEEETAASLLLDGNLKALSPPLRVQVICGDENLESLGRLLSFYTSRSLISLKLGLPQCSVRWIMRPTTEPCKVVVYPVPRSAIRTSLESLAYRGQDGGHPSLMELLLEQVEQLTDRNTALSTRQWLQNRHAPIPLQPDELSRLLGELNPAEEDASTQELVDLLCSRSHMFSHPPEMRTAILGKVLPISDEINPDSSRWQGFMTWLANMMEPSPVCENTWQLAVDSAVQSQPADPIESALDEDDSKAVCQISRCERHGRCIAAMVEVYLSIGTHHEVKLWPEAGIELTVLALPNAKELQRQPMFEQVARFMGIRGQLGSSILFLHDADSSGVVGTGKEFLDPVRELLKSLEESVNVGLLAHSLVVESVRQVSGQLSAESLGRLWFGSPLRMFIQEKNLLSLYIRSLVHYLGDPMGTQLPEQSVMVIAASLYWMWLQDVRTMHKHCKLVLEHDWLCENTVQPADGSQDGVAALPAVEETPAPLPALHLDDGENTRNLAEPPPLSTSALTRSASVFHSLQQQDLIGQSLENSMMWSTSAEDASIVKSQVAAFLTDRQTFLKTLVWHLVASFRYNFPSDKSMKSAVQAEDEKVLGSIFLRATHDTLGSLLGQSPYSKSAQLSASIRASLGKMLGLQPSSLSKPPASDMGLGVAAQEFRKVKNRMSKQYGEKTSRILDQALRRPTHDPKTCSVGLLEGNSLCLLCPFVLPKANRKNRRDPAREASVSSLPTGVSMMLSGTLTSTENRPTGRGKSMLDYAAVVAVDLCVRLGMERPPGWPQPDTSSASAFESARTGLVESITDWIYSEAVRRRSIRWHAKRMIEDQAVAAAVSPPEVKTISQEMSQKVGNAWMIERGDSGNLGNEGTGAGGWLEDGRIVLNNAALEAIGVHWSPFVRMAEELIERQGTLRVNCSELQQLRSSVVGFVDLIVAAVYSLPELKELTLQWSSPDDREIVLEFFGPAAGSPTLDTLRLEYIGKHELAEAASLRIPNCVDALISGLMRPTRPFPWLRQVEVVADAYAAELERWLEHGFTDLCGATYGPQLQRQHELFSEESSQGFARNRNEYLAFGLFRWIKALGEGNYSVVLLAKYFERDVALKVLRPDPMAFQQRNEFESEVEKQISAGRNGVAVASVLARTQVSYQEFSLALERLPGASNRSMHFIPSVATLPVVVMEYYHHGSVDKWLALTHAQVDRLDSGRVRKALLDILRQAAMALSGLQALKMAHCDVASRNLLIKTADDEGYPTRVVLSDFGLALRLENEESKFKFPPGKACLYLMPKDCLYSLGSSDIWQFAILMLEVAGGMTASEMSQKRWMFFLDLAKQEQPPQRAVMSNLVDERLWNLFVDIVRPAAENSPLRWGEILERLRAIE